MDSKRISWVIRKRNEIILSICRGKRVLDVGCGGQAIPFWDPRWTHAKIARVARHAVGIDIQKEMIRKARQAGYDVRYADAQNFDLSEKFEVATLIELIEHVSNPGLVLDCVHKHLIKEGIMIITTPNPFNPFIFKTYELNNRGNLEHVGYYAPTMFSRLAKRHHLHEEMIIWLLENWRDPRTLKGKLFLLLMRKLLPKRFFATCWLGVYKKLEK